MIFPGEMLVDYVRVYQRRGAINVGCDPKDYPTKKYIDDHLPAYSGTLMPLVEGKRSPDTTI
jgi:beta-glucan synthesis-associated protein KRE6